MRDLMIRVCSRCNSSTAPGVAVVLVLAVAVSAAAPHGGQAGEILAVLRDAAAVALVWAGGGMAWVTARLLSREPVVRGRRVLYQAPPQLLRPPAPVPDARNYREAPVPVPPPAPPVIFGQPAAPARPEPASPQVAADDQPEVRR